MKKAFRTILLVIIGVSVVGLAALWIGGSVWPGLFAYLQERKAAYEAFFLATGGISGVITLALSLLDKVSQPTARTETDLLKPVTIEDIHKSVLPHDQDYPYYDRGIVSDDDLRSGRVFILKGGMKCGKNAEAEQVIRRLIDLGRANPERIYDISGWRREIGADPQNYLGQRLSNPRSVLFLEQIPHPCSEKDIEWLDAFAEAARRHDGFLVTTLRGDLLDGRLGGWLERQQGKTAMVVGDCARPMTETDTGRLIDWLSFTYQVKISPSGRDLLVKKADRAYPYHLITMFQEYRRQGLAQAPDEQLGADVQKSLAQLWQGIRAGLQEQQPAVGPLLAALAEFQAAGVTPFTELVFARAPRLPWPGIRLWQPALWRTALDSAASSLGVYGVTFHHYGVFRYPEAMPPLGEEPEQAIQNLVKFFNRLSPWWENRITVLIAKRLHWFFYGNIARYKFINIFIITFLIFIAIWSAMGPASLSFSLKLASFWLEQLKIFYILIVIWFIVIFSSILASHLNPIWAERATVWVEIGLQLQAQNRYVDAESAYRNAIATDPDIGVSWIILGFLISKEPNRMLEGVQAIRQGLAIDPRNAIAWNNFGNLLYQQLGQTSEAECAYQKALASDSKYVVAWANLGALLTKQPGREVDAEDAFRQCVAIDPEYRLAWINLGNLLAELPGRVAAAEEAYCRVLAIDPRDEETWLLLGVLLTNQPGREADAEDAFRQAVALNPLFPYSFLGLGNALTKQPGRDVEAEAAIRKALELDLNNDAAWYTLGHLLTQQPGRAVEAEVAFRKVLDIDLQNTYAWNNLGYLLAPQPGREAEAEAAYRKALEIDPWTSETWKNLGDLLKAQGRLDEAEEAYRRAADPPSTGA